MIYFLLAYLTLLTLAVLRRDGGQVVASGLLFGNWAINCSFVYFSGCLFAWPWFITTDWLTAIILYVDRETRWQRLLVASYAIELIMHASFAMTAGDRDVGQWARTDAHLYWAEVYYRLGMNVVAYAQIALVGSWIAYDAARYWRRNRGRVSSAVAGNKPETARWS